MVSHGLYSVNGVERWNPTFLAQSREKGSWQGDGLSKVWGNQWWGSSKQEAWLSTYETWL